MITAVKAENISAYKALFEEASDILSGYKRVRTYDGDIADYYYKNANATNSDELFKIPMVKEGEEEVPAINSLVSFSRALETYGILYVKNGEVTEGFEPMIGITTLEEYYSWLRNLSELKDTSGEEIGRKYTVLPLDEEHFEINANTRAINIPASFKKNGIAVQGDDLAEVVYFKVDRYFDYMDLNTTEIYIQWETPKDANGDVKKSVSPAYIRDIESEPGKLIFGWAISDAITGVSGPLKFSVRFFKWEDENKVEINENNEVVGEKVIAYSFNTLTATINILQSIGFNPETEDYKLDDGGERILGRIENSEIAGGYAAATPIFVKDLDDPNANLIYDLDPSADPANTLELLVQAYSTDTGAITYTWKHKVLDELNSSEGQPITTLTGENVMIEANLNDLSKTFTYYYIATYSEGVPIYQPYKGTLPPAADWADNVNEGKLFVRQSMIKADKAGEYYVIVENRITNSSNSITSKVAKFPRPELVVISKQPDVSDILESVAGEEDSYACELSVVADNKDGVLTYQWQMDSNDSPSFGETEPNFVNIVDVDDEGNPLGTSATYKATEPGHYRVVITNTRNLAITERISDNTRVTYPAQIPVIDYMAMSAHLDFKLSALTDANCPTVILDETIESDKYTASWYLSKTDSENNTLEIEIAKDLEIPQGEYRAYFNPKNYEEVIKELSQEDNIEGSYYAKITNHVNGSMATTEAPTYTNMFKVTS